MVFEGHTESGLPVLFIVAVGAVTGLLKKLVDNTLEEEPDDSYTL